MSSHLKELKTIRTSWIFRLWEARDFILTDKEALFFLERSRQGLRLFRKKPSKYDSVATETMRRLVYSRVNVSTWREFAALNKMDIVKRILTVEEKVIIHRAAVNLHRLSGLSVNKLRVIAREKVLRGRTGALKPWLKSIEHKTEEIEELIREFLGEVHE